MVVLPESRLAILVLVSALMPSSAIRSAAARTRRRRRSSASTLAGMVLVHPWTAADLDGQLDQTADDQAGQVPERLVTDDVDTVDVPGQRADGVPGLHAGENVADARVDALPEGDVRLRGRAVGVEPIAVGEDRLVAVGRQQRDNERRGGWQGHAAERGVLDHPPEDRSRRAGNPYRFFDDLVGAGLV